MQNSPEKTKCDAPSTLSSTEAAVLGLLSRGERSGYDLNKLAEGGVGYVWAPAKSQIYAVLPRLVASGYASARSLRQKRRPDKQLYRLTAKGRRALRAWLEAPAEEPVARNPFLLKVFFGGQMDRVALVAQIERERLEAKAELAELREMERESGGREESFYGYLTLRYGLAQARARIRWADEVSRELEARDRQPKRAS